MAKITNTGVFIVEGSAAAADVAGSSQIWTKSDTPSSLYHTDDAGTDFRINGTTVSAEQATTSGTSIDFTGIPAGVTVIKLMLTGVSNNGSSALMVQLGDSGGIETSAYVCNASNDSGESTQSTAGFLCGVSFNQATGTLTTGILTICLKDSANNEWVAFGGMGETQSSYNIETIGSKSLSGVLTQVRLTAINGSDVFDAGSAAIQFQ